MDMGGVFGIGCNMGWEGCIMALGGRFWGSEDCGMGRGCFMLGLGGGTMAQRGSNMGWGGCNISRGGICIWDWGCYSMGMGRGRGV